MPFLAFSQICLIFKDVGNPSGAPLTDNRPDQVLKNMLRESFTA